MGSSAIPRFWSAPPGLYSGQDEDPIAALIGKGLQAFGAVRSARQQEQDRQQRLQREDTQERDTANWRNLQTGIQLAGAGLTTQAPQSAPTVTPKAGSTVAGLDAGLGQTPDITPGASAQPVVSVGGQNLYRTGPSAAEQKATETDARTRVIHQRVGHALAVQMFGHDVDDETAEGIGSAPASFSSFQRSEQPKFTPVHGPSGEVLAFDPQHGTARTTGTTVGATQSFGGMGGVTGREAQAAAKAAQDAAAEMVSLYGKDKASATIPTRGVVASGLGHLAGKLGGHDVESAIAVQGLTSNQQLFRKAADRLLHNVSALLPKGGRSVTILNNLRASFTPGPGQTDPAVVERTVQAAQAIADLYGRALRGENVNVLDELENIGAGVGLTPLAPPPAAPHPQRPSVVPNFQKFSTQPVRSP